jgi:hypothetical protein
MPVLAIKPLLPLQADPASRPSRAHGLLLFATWLLLLANALSLAISQPGPLPYSGDQINILSICQILDHPDRWRQDMLGADPASLEYYAPLYVGALRWLAVPIGGYLPLHRTLLGLLILVYFWGWYHLFRRWLPTPSALIMAWLVKGVLWPAGNELWGIAGVWTLIPRTVYFAALPWLLLPALKGGLRGFLATALGLGALAQIHPISALSGGALFATLVAAAPRTFHGLSLRQRLLVLATLVLALAPYVLLYVRTVMTAKGFDQNAFSIAIYERIPELFFHPGLYMLRWARPQWALFLLGPFLLWPFFGRRMPPLQQKTFAVAALGILASFALATLPFLAEALLARLGVNAHFAFQLVRNGKWAIPFAFLHWALLLGHCLTQVPRWVGPLLAILLPLLALASSRGLGAGWPLLGDDLLRMQWPVSLQTKEESQLHDALVWAEQHSPGDSLWVGPRQLRVYPGRQVLFDMAGAGLLIEGNPRLFLQAVQRKQLLRRQGTLAEKLDLLTTWGAHYALVSASPGASPGRHQLLYANPGWQIFSLRPILGDGRP